MRRLFAIIILIGIPYIAGAQATVGDAAAIDFSPQYPGPNESVTLTAVSYSIALDQSIITWRRNGSIIASARGLRTVTTTVGALGKATTFQVTMSDPSGSLLAASINITPAIIDLVWEPETDSHPLIRSKNGFSYGERLRFTALPLLISNGKQVADSDLIYTWSVNNRVLGSASGYGKSSIELTAPQPYRTMEILVEARTVNGATVGGTNMYIQSANPYALYFRDDPLAGLQLQNGYMRGFKLSQEEETLFVVPFRLSGGTERQLAWKINNRTVTNPSSNPYLITLRKEGGLGTARLTASFNHTENFLQQISQNLVVSFTQ